MGQELPETCRILKLVVGSFKLDTVLRTEASSMDSFVSSLGNFFNTYEGGPYVTMRRAPERLSTPLPEVYIV